MTADLLHLVRHGEVENPDGILYGRLPNFGLSARGHRMAALAAESLRGRPVSSLFASPLQRAQESAAPWSTGFELPIVTEDRIIEPTNRFEGGRMNARRIVTTPSEWAWVRNPWLPSWGEPYLQVAGRMFAAMDEAWTTADGGEVVMVSHQMPIVMVARTVARRRLAHDPRKRRCALSSITTLRRVDGVWSEVGYQEPAASLLKDAIDTGAV